MARIPDIAGLVKGASKGEGLGNQFLSHIREVDAIVHVVRCFEDANIVHVEGSIDPLRDIETINLELIFSDMEVLDRRIQRTIKAVKADKSLQAELEILETLKTELENGKCARSITWNSEDEQKFVDSLQLLTQKPVLYAANVTEEDLINNGQNNPFVETVKKFALEESSEVFIICAKIEEEIAELDDDEKNIFLEELGIQDTGLDRLIAASYRLLGLISYLSRSNRNQSMDITRGTKAPQAAGKIHTDFEKGFIRAEVVAYDDLIHWEVIQPLKKRD